MKRFKTINPLVFCLLSMFILLNYANGFAQSDSLFQKQDSTFQKQDSTAIILNDSTRISLVDSVKQKEIETPVINSTEKSQPSKKKKSYLSSVVNTTTTDSIYFNMKTLKAYLYKNANLKYETVDMTSGYVEVDFKKNELFAMGIADSLGNESETPVFKDGETEFRSKQMNYNFKSEKGLIKEVITEEGEGYLHGERVKKVNEEINYIKHGKYTTCNLDHPHFAFKFNKAKTTKTKLITGPIYPVIADVPIPIGLPFAYLPKQKGQRSGILIPTYGESAERGFFFENGGYYFGINDYLDAEIRGDIYTRGSWAIKPSVRYKLRYKFSGNFGLSYAVNIDKNDKKQKDFSISWSHNQDAKAHPNSKFSANVNIKSSKFNELNPTSSQDFLTNTYSSSINYQTKLFNTLNFTAKAGHNQNTKTHTVNVTLPEIAISAPRFYPLKRKNQVGGERWYEKISVNYAMNISNKLVTQDSMFREEYMNRLIDDFKNGLNHNISVQHNSKFLKYLNMNIGAKYTERWYSRRIEKYWFEDSTSTTDPTLVENDFIYHRGPDNTNSRIIDDTTYGFYEVRNFSARASINTTIYGQKNFRKGYLRAVRHVVKPSISFNYQPDFSTDFWGYYDEIITTDTNNPVVEYSYYANNIYGNAPKGKSGIIAFDIGNNLEIKIRDRNDTINGGVKKIKLIESFNVRASYNMAADSVKWSKLTLSGRTSFLKNKLRLSYAASFDPYVLNSKRKQTNTFEWTANKRLFRKENVNWGLNLSYNIKSTEVKKLFSSDKGSEAELEQINQNPGDYLDWNNPWSLSIDYSLKYTNAYSQALKAFEQKFIQTLNFNGDVQITKKWKVGVKSGYDFEAKDFTYTSLNIYRDLHCWSMKFNWIPTGIQKSWSFTIQAKSALLQDLKLERKRDFRDNF